MIEGLAYAISLLKRGAARHKYYHDLYLKPASKNVHRANRHLGSKEACLGAVKMLQCKRNLILKLEKAITPEKRKLK